MPEQFVKLDRQPLFDFISSKATSFSCRKELLEQFIDNKISSVRSERRRGNFVRRYPNKDPEMISVKTVSVWVKEFSSYQKSGW